MHHLVLSQCWRGKNRWAEWIRKLYWLSRHALSKVQNWRRPSSSAQSLLSYCFSLAAYWLNCGEVSDWIRGATNEPHSIPRRLGAVWCLVTGGVWQCSIQVVTLLDLNLPDTQCMVGRPTTVFRSCGLPPRGGFAFVVLEVFLHPIRVKSFSCSVLTLSPYFAYID